jgi:hypothetical protein
MNSDQGAPRCSRAEPETDPLKEENYMSDAAETGRHCGRSRAVLFSSSGVCAIVARFQRPHTKDGQCARRRALRIAENYLY